MGKPTGFIELERRQGKYRPIEERIQHFKEFTIDLGEAQLRDQGARCMDCGIPFCHSDEGCPVDNLIPDWNDHVYDGNWREAIDSLHTTNNFPEFTGRICPAPCEAACTVNLYSEPVTIKQIEKNIADRAWSEGWIAPRPAKTKTGKKVAVVGSGPAGLACAQQLARAGHDVTVFEKKDRIGGLLRYGIPDFKMEKQLIDRRIEQMEAEGVHFRVNAHVGDNVSIDELKNGFDSVVLAGGSEKPRGLDVEGRELKGVHFAMTFLEQQNRRNAGDIVPDEEAILATGKVVVVIGGGDTGSDCIGTSKRQGAKAIHQFEILPRPPEKRPADNPWPTWPRILRTSSSQEEGCERRWSVLTKALEGEAGTLKRLKGCDVEWAKDEEGRFGFHEVPGSEFTMDADLVLMAMGFLHPVQQGMLDQLGVAYDGRGNVKAGVDYQTSVPGIFSAGDMRRGQSLVVWAIREGRHCAHHVDKFLMGQTALPGEDRRI